MFITLLWILFVISALLLCLLILIQEGKGGGLAEAFGGQGAETFGVKATGVNYFTAGLAGLLFVTAILINKCGYQTGGVRFDSGASTPASTDTAPEGGAAGGAADGTQGGEKPN
jgi:preprotein translocase subunit SecG